MKRDILHGFSTISSYAWFLYSQRENLFAKEILIPNDGLALSIAEQIRAFDPSLEVEVLCPLETDLLRNRGPSDQRRRERIRFFSKRQNAELAKNCLFLMSAEALCQKSPSREFWALHTLEIPVGAALDVHLVTEKLAILGYQSVEIVEKPFEFARRGSIVDVFSPLYSRPIRLELFGDEVESLHSFFPESQRRDSVFKKVFIPPAREYVYPESKEELASLKSKLRKHLDDANWEREDRSAFLERIVQGTHFSTADYWAPLLSEKENASAAPKKLTLGVVIDLQACLSSIQQKSLLFERNLLSARIEGEWVPTPSIFIESSEESIKQVKSEDTTSNSFELKKNPSPLVQERQTDIKISGQEVFLEKLRALHVQHPDHMVSEVAKMLLQRTQLEGIRHILFSSSGSEHERLRFLLGQNGITMLSARNLEEAILQAVPFTSLIGDLESGFLDVDKQISLLSDQELLGIKKRKIGQKVSRQSFHDVQGNISIAGLRVNDHVVHKELGIAIFLGLKHMRLSGMPGDFAELQFKDGKVFLPVTRLGLMQKYSGSAKDTPLDRLSTRSWDQKKKKAKKELRSIAGELLNLYSKRKIAMGPRIQPEKERVEEFASSFSYVETPDQAQAIEDTLKDMEGPGPMDRLICGDVGYGKTEIALRAAYSAVLGGYQVAILAPTTLLAAQHFKNFKERLSPFGIDPVLLSRFVSAKDAKKIKENLLSGTSKIVVGTHRLLSSDISFHKLGLMVVDEEQRFGVTHKEKIKKLKTDVHVLTMTATPIPRTMNMAMTGMRELSIIATPPQSRLSVRTHIARKKDELIKDVITQEIKRGGQVFYVHNRVMDIEKVQGKLKELLPGLSITYVHGQMEEGMLEERMMGFYEGRTQVLLTTSIIESGLDVPNANTLIVDRADRFGLAQLYQIRGRVGRSDKRAYAYFLIPSQGSLSKDADERLQVLESYQELGSGFHIASHDLEIRGAGDLLGRSQSGQINALGFETFSMLMEQCLAEAKGDELVDTLDPEINIPIDTCIPEDFLPELGLRLLFYRRLSASLSENDIHECELELQDRFGPLPRSVQNLLITMRMKCQLRRLGVKTLKAGKKGYSLAFDPSTNLDPARLVIQIKKYPQHFHLSPEGKLTILQGTENQEEQALLQNVESALSQLETLLH